MPLKVFLKTTLPLGGGTFPFILAFFEKKQAVIRLLFFACWRMSFLLLHCPGFVTRIPGKFAQKGVSSLPGVYLNEDEYNFDIALRRFKKQVEKAGILSEMKKRQHYEKPSVMRKKKKAAARKRLMKKMRKQNLG